MKGEGNEVLGQPREIGALKSIVVLTMEDKGMKLNGLNGFYDGARA